MERGSSSMPSASFRPWAVVITSPGAVTRAGALEAGRREGRDVLAFNAGVMALASRPDVVLKLDADVSVEANFFERLLGEFQADPLLGIAGGVCLELEHGEWRERFVAGSHVRGATRAYRRACLEDVSPLVERLGWDGLDEAKATLSGWHVRQHSGTAVPPPPPGRPTGRCWQLVAIAGATARFMGYRFWYLAVRSIFWARRDPRAVAMIAGWLKDAIARRPMYDDPAVVAQIRREQSLRKLPLRAREALGLRTSRELVSHRG